MPSHAHDAAQPRRVALALADLREGFARLRLARELAWLDLRNRYRGSVLGPFWVTLSTAAMLVGLGLLYSRLFGLSLAEYLPHLAVSLVVWNVLNGLVTDACASLTSAEGVVRQMRVPYTVHALRCVFRNAMTAAHNLPLVFVVFLATGHMPGAEALGALAGLALFAVNAFAAALFLGPLCARFRDIGPIMANVMQLAFFLTPVIWKPQLLGEGAAWLPLNPFYTLLETVRGPLVEGGAGATVWAAAVLYTALACAAAGAFFARFRGRVAFWV